ncbi:hypothetical protein [Flavobacterium sp. KACC 22763]|uniref:hypothetical protein n=1 Tax=Flavobacterium sp. KACC 22763 TaxID=3025668 RepID=UPI002364FFF3|nr:hypothetical protein [Flavobacterium sp. KACC 22763]WDF64291.1 hypothetical protein PQ463_22065 [Flavobacterium sp. KACC 22763]
MNIYKRYKLAKEDFHKHKKGSLYNATKSAESLFDIMYELENYSKDQNQSYLLAKIYYELGWKWECRKFIKTHLSSNKLNYLNKLKWKYLLNKVEDLFKVSHYELIEYRDLRTAKKRNLPQTLLRNDFIFNEEVYFIIVSIKSDFNDIILLNKKVLNEEVEFSIEKESSIIKFIEKTNSHLSWINNSHKDLINYYNENYQQILSSIGRLDYGKANDEWYDGLRVDSVGFHYNSNEKLEGFYTIYDYYNMNSGFHIDTLDNSIVDLYYNTDL